MSIKIYNDNGTNSIKQIKEIEESLNYKLPKLFKELMMKHDALRLDNDVFDFINYYEEEDERDINFSSFKKECKNSFILDEQINVNDVSNNGIIDLIVFVFFANGDYVCFDYRHNPMTDNSKVVLVYHDDFVDYEDCNSHMVINHVADSFEEFMEMLHE
ncbi:SMI1/KNR4 family protein [Psychrobacter urativorans]|uniref:SMI1/KNR4 family protein n=1 Tax=Psychrobacter urativorans TaxID=45610 RepID=UPI001D0FE02B|nr:SMI1/KNR4 family protein [Psychrobacter urativorans]